MSSEQELHKALEFYRTDHELYARTKASKSNAGRIYQLMSLVLSDINRQIVKSSIDHENVQIETEERSRLTRLGRRITSVSIFNKKVLIDKIKEKLLALHVPVSKINKTTMLQQRNEYLMNRCILQSRKPYNTIYNALTFILTHGESIRSSFEAPRRYPRLMSEYYDELLEHEISKIPPYLRLHANEYLHSSSDDIETTYMTSFRRGRPARIRLSTLNTGISASQPADQHVRAIQGLRQNGGYRSSIKDHKRRSRSRSHKSKK